MHSSETKRSSRRRLSLSDSNIFSSGQFSFKKDRSRQNLQQQYSYSRIGGSANETILPLTMSSYGAPNTSAPSSGKKVRSSVLGASRKIVKATVRRPLKTVGRIVGRGGRSNGIESDDLDLDHLGEEVEDVGEEVILREIDDGDASVSSAEIILSTRQGECDRFRGSVHSVRGHTGEILHHRIQSRSKRGDPDWPVHAMERFLRQILMVFAAYLIGAKRPEWFPTVSRSIEYAVTAWGTCVGILFLTFMQRRYPNLMRQTTSPSSVTAPPSVHPRELEAELDAEVNERTHLLQDDKRAFHESELSTAAAAAVAAAEDPGDLEPVPSTEEPANALLPHPALTPFYIMDHSTGERITPNAEEPFRIENEWFDMEMIVMIRTPDVDDESVPGGSQANQKVSSYLRGKQRRFEFQYQMKLKKRPDGKAVYFACHLDEPIKMGVIQRAFVGAAMAFVKTTNPTFHYSIQGSTPSPDGKWEKPCMSFTAQGSLDRLVVTKPHETPPKLGEAIHEDPESIKQRKKGVPIDWNTEDTYTMALWTSYVDFLDWRVINLPGIRPFNLTSVLGLQHMGLTLYLIDENKVTDKHYQKDIETIVHFELSNERAASLGPIAKQWTKGQIVPKHKPKRPIAKTDVDDVDLLVSKGSSVKAEIDGNNSISKPTPLTESPTHREVNATKSVDGFDENEDIEQDQDAATAAELGEGIYLRSGDSVTLREFIMDGIDDDTNNTVTNGGGFAVLQNQDVSIIIEKARRAKRNRLIKTGDTVLFKMVQQKGDGSETRYLSIHRGWWLKWVSSAPTKNGYFTIYPHDSEVGQHGEEKTAGSVETQSSYLTIGGNFTLRHKRWSKYYVGVAAEPSPTYGGRMLGLYIPSSSKGGKAEIDKGGKASDDNDNSDEDAANDIADYPAIIDETSKEKAPWMKPLVLSAQDPCAPPTSLTVPGTQDVANANYDETVPDSAGVSEKLIFSSDHCQLDVPAWIEMMNRTDRVKHLAYVVRVTHRPAGSTSFDSKTDDSEMFDPNVEDCTTVFARLRTGRELAHIMRFGQANAAIWAKSSAPDTMHSKPRSLRRVTIDGSSTQATSTRNLRPSVSSGGPVDGLSSPAKREGTLSLSPRLQQSSISNVPMDLAFESLAKEGSVSEDDSAEDAEDEGEEDPGVERYDWVGTSGEEVSSPDEREPERERHEPSKKGAVRKGRAIIGKVAKTAKTATVVTGKTAVKTVAGTGKLTAKAAIGTGKLTAKAAVGTGKLTGKVAVGAGKIAVRGSKKVAKGTVNAGKAVAVTAGKAVIAPVTRKSKHPPKQEPKRKKDRSSKDVEVKSKTMKRIERLESRASRHPTVLAGELCAPEQSCRTTSRVLSRMSSLPMSSPVWSKANDVLSSQLSFENEQDKLFLKGNSVQMGVTPLQSRGTIHLESAVARCIWESHWREEWCGMYETCISFYAPMTKSPSLEIAFIDIQNVRPLDAGHFAPLPGFPLLVLETAWLCHYVAFRDEETRDTFGEKVEDAVARHVKQVEESASIQERELRKARFWQEFQAISESSLSTGRGKWATVSSAQKHKHRTILNGRRMVFDLHTDMTNGYAFVEEMTAAALSFSPESLENDPDTFIDFLDSISHLRLLPLEEIDSTGKEAFCLFVNIYHCLLQHAMLLSVNGAIDRRSVGHFMRTTSYEIGDDVFSLAEINASILRGKMSRPVNPKPPYIEAPKKSNAHRIYALEYSDARINFVLNTGDVACPSSVPVLRAEEVEQQLNDAAAVFLKKQLHVDTSRRLVVLPKVCEVYKNDFGSDSLSCLKFCMGGLDEGTASSIRVLMMDESALAIRYQHTAEQYHSHLTLRDGDGIQMTSLLNALYQTPE